MRIIIERGSENALYCVYRFLNERSEVIYVGRTNNLHRRMNEHFTGIGHLPQKCYNETTGVEYVDFTNANDMRIFEIYYIAKCSPKYNSMYNNEESKTIFSIIEPKWESINITKKSKEIDVRIDMDDKVEEAIRKHLCLAW